MQTVVHSPRAVGRTALTSTECASVVGLAGLVVAGLLSPAHIANGPVVCPFRLLTGLPCPGCGLTRSWVYLTHGEWHRALSANPFGYVLALGVIVAIGYAATCRIRGRAPADLNAIVRLWSVRIVVAGWLAFAIIRLVVDAT